MAIAKTVGQGGINKPVDVIKVQNLINNNDLYTGLSSPLTLTGKVDDAMIQAIMKFQSNHPEIKANNPDGRVDPGGRTLAKLNQYSNKNRNCKDYLPIGFKGNQLMRFNVDSFLDLYALQYPPLGSLAGHGLKQILNCIFDDPDILDIGWAAYMLATVKHECANKWQPIEEYSKGLNKEYGKAVKVKDPDSNDEFTNVYYGRGYVQLTWDYNYKRMDKAFGYSGASSLYLHPEKALDPDIAYDIMSYGMRNGSFTGVGLSRYINAGRADYLNARKIINGEDMNELIKTYADNIEFLLRFCNGV